MSRAEALYRLQVLDLDIDKAVRRAREIDAALKSNPAVAHAIQEHEAVKNVLGRVQAEHKLIELDVQALDDKIKAEEQRLYGGGIHATKEMLDTQHELESLKRRRAALDENYLQAMLAVDEARATEKRVQAAVADAQAKWGEDSVHIRDELQELRVRYAGLAEQRKGQLGTIARADLDVYAALRARKPNGVAVAMIKGGVCGACGEEPASQTAQQAKLGTALVTCSSCGRILYGP